MHVYHVRSSVHISRLNNYLLGWVKIFMWEHSMAGDKIPSYIVASNFKRNGILSLIFTLSEHYTTPHILSIRLPPSHFAHFFYLLVVFSMFLVFCILIIGEALRKLLLLFQAESIHRNCVKDFSDCCSPLPHPHCSDAHRHRSHRHLGGLQPVFVCNL